MLIDFILCNFPFLRLSFVLFVCLLVLCIRMFEGAAASFFTSAHPFSFPTLVLLHFLHSPLSTPYTRSLTLPSPTLFAHSLLLSFSLFLLTLFAHSFCSLSLLTLFAHSLWVFRDHRYAKNIEASTTKGPSTTKVAGGEASKACAIL